MKKNLIVIGVACCMFLVSCTTPTEHSGTSTSLVLEYPSVTMGMNNGMSIGISGGTPPYTVKSISDSSVISAYVYRDFYSTVNQASFVSKNKTGSAVVTFRDSIGTTGSVRVTVEEFAVFPEEVTMMEMSNTNIRMQGGTMPYTVVQGYDTTVARFSDALMPYLFARRAGQTVITVTDASPQKRTKRIYVTVLPRPRGTEGMLTFASTFGDRNFSGTTDPYIIDHSVKGAAGMGMVSWSGWFEYGNIIGILPKPEGQFEIAMLGLSAYGSLFIPGVYPFESTLAGPDPNFNFVSVSMSLFISSSAEPGVTGERFVLTQGQLSITEIRSGRLKGSFYGTGYKRNYGSFGLDSTRPFAVSNGAFDVPYTPDVQHSAAEPGAAARIIRPELPRGELFLNKYLR
jgi:hypothetical protein